MTDFLPSPSNCAVAVVWTGPDRLSGYLQRLGGDLRECLVLTPGGPPKRPETGAEITHLPGLPGLGAGEVELIRFSLPGLVALHPASDELRALYPSIRETERFWVAVLGPDSLRDRAEAFEGPLTLVVDTPGGERETFEAMQAAGIVDRTSDLLLRCGRDALFEGGWTGEEALTWLQARHFEVIGSNDADPDWPEFTLRFDPRGRRIAELESELAARDKALADARDAEAAAAETIQEMGQTVAALKTEQESLRSEIAEHEKKAAEAATALKDAQRIAGEREAEADEQRATMTSQLAELSEKLAAAEAEASRHAAAAAELENKLTQHEVALADAGELKEKLAAAEAEASRHAAAAAELENKLTQHEVALADAGELKEKLAAAEAEASRHAAAEAELENKLTQHEAALADTRALRDELDEVKSELSVAIRMQSLAQDDLRELQQRFRKVSESRQEQAALLLKLIPHLKALREQTEDRPERGDIGEMRTIDHVPDDSAPD